MSEVLLDALIDTLKVFPFLLIIYIVIELIEHKTEVIGSKNRLNGKFAPLIGAATGLIPQCGFSVMSAKLYESGFIKLGTLIAIFISTSDEAFIILLSSGTAAMQSLLYMIVIKVAVGAAAGYIINAVCKNEEVNISSPVDYKRRMSDKKFECTSCGKEHDENHPVVTYFVNPLLHSLKVAAYILVVNIIFGIIIYYVGEDSLSAFLQKSVWAQSFISAAVGLIPNCASSVVITETYLMGGITFGSCVAGLCTNAGLGLVILIKNTAKWKRNIAIVAVMYFIGVAVGSVINLFATVISVG